MAFWTRKSAASKSISPDGTAARGLPRGRGTATEASVDFEPAPFDPTEGLPPQVHGAEESRSESLYVAPETQSGHAFGINKQSIVDGELVEPGATDERARSEAKSASAQSQPPAPGQEGIADGPTVATKQSERRTRFGLRGAERTARKAKDSEKYTADWLRGSKGRPTQVFIGFLPDVNKNDAISFAIGVANRHCINIVNTAYGVYKHNSGWAYEVHEGGPRRAYLPKILKRFEEQAGGPIREEDAVVIDTAQKKVRVERTQLGLTAFMMPESFQAQQTSWLEPGGKLKPVVPLRVWLIVLGGLFFLTGFITLVTTLATRPSPPPLNAPARVALPYSQLPISQWQPLVSTYERGDVISALRWEHNQWLIQTKQTASKPVKTASLPKESPPDHRNPGQKN